MQADAVDKTANLKARIAQESRRLELFSNNWTYWLGEEFFVRAISDSQSHSEYIAWPLLDGDPFTVRV